MQNLRFTLPESHLALNDGRRFGITDLNMHYLRFNLTYITFGSLIT